MARPLSVPVPPFVIVTGCAAGLAAPAVATNETVCDESAMTGTGGGCVGWAAHAIAPALSNNERIRRIQPLTKELPGVGSDRSPHSVLISTVEGAGRYRGFARDRSLSFYPVRLFPFVAASRSVSQ